MHQKAKQIYLNCRDVLHEYARARISNTVVIGYFSYEQVPKFPGWATSINGFLSRKLDLHGNSVLKYNSTGEREREREREVGREREGRERNERRGEI